MSTVHAKEPRYTHIAYCPKHMQGIKRFLHELTHFYVHGSIPAEIQLTWFDRMWSTIVDDSLTRDEIPEDTHIIELDDIRIYHPDCLR